MINRLNDMELLTTITVGYWDITRVPTGWIFNKITGGCTSELGVFVPDTINTYNEMRVPALDTYFKSGQA